MSETTKRTTPKCKNCGREAIVWSHSGNCIICEPQENAMSETTKEKLKKVNCPYCGKEHFIMLGIPFFGDQRICAECSSNKTSYIMEKENE